jgi:ABC-type Zn uptake system ZnuABC Zn-binding protein ZnuA
VDEFYQVESTQQICWRIVESLSILTIVVDGGIRMKKSVFVIIAFMLAAIASAPAAVHAQKEGGVLTSFYPMQVFALNVTKGIPELAPVLMLPAPLGCPHDYALTPGDVAKINKAKVLIVNGTMETFITPRKMKKLNPKLTLIDSGEDFADIAGEDEHAEATAKKGDKHKAGHGAEHAHSHGDFNPHTWVSPFIAAKQVRVIGKQLAEIYPDHAQTLTANAQGYAARLEALGAQMKQELAKLPHKKIITFHDAFDYLARDMGLEIVGVIELAPGVNPSAKHMKEIIALTQQHKLSTIFAEVQYPEDVAKVIAKEAGALVRVLDPVASGDTPEAGAYEAVMMKNLEVLREALR